ncbi:DNA primase DnaG [archaeon]|nr:DNA primase DnaG [archaeon]MDD2477697.1 DNA primase DnaG [Candidatus ainarchaeum sp.]MDD3084550.1 DNA primase DnaG [Candidatus ainarchaeum sp.]MDD4221274.1 DNA primase DnaG [Candidatus ainarchaeum sp.]MDD4662793.1 DNA primase DnaG [Candidatus ainarchaeum sp.]
MGKTYLETIKYMIVADFEVEGLVERPDVIGAIFGQSEGLLGSQLDIKELQQNGKIGRIEITVNHSNNKTNGTLKLPCSLSMVETAIIAASIESIDKVGPCDTSFKIKQIEDTRGLKRKQIKDRAIDLLGKLMQEEIPDTRELMDEITDSFKTRDIILYGPEKLPSGPTIENSKEVTIVEGRADVINMLKYGFTNIISTGGARVPKTLADIVKDKVVTLFLDGDRGAEIQQAQLLKAIRVDYVARAPDGKEVEELTQKEINQALRRKIKASYLESSSRPRQPGLIKNTKFSVTHEHKFKNQQFPKSTFTPTRVNEPKKTDDSFSSMLSSIPNVERVDVDKQGGSSFEQRQNNRHNSNNQNRDRNFNRNSNFRQNQSRSTNNQFKPRDYNQSSSGGRVNNYADSSKGNLNNQNKVYSDSKAVEEKITDLKKQITLKQKVEDAIKKLNITSRPEQIRVSKREDSLSPLTSKQEANTVTSQAQSKVDSKDNQETQKQKTPEKKELPKKPIVLPKLTEKISKNFIKILEEVDGKNTSRILNEKFRRIGSSKNSDLEYKLKGFKQNKIFAVVTDKDPDADFINLCKEKGVLFLVVPKSKIKEDKEINIVTYNDLKK